MPKRKKREKGVMQGNPDLNSTPWQDAEVGCETHKNESLYGKKKEKY